MGAGKSRAVIMRIAVLGAGAAGCLCAIELKRRLPDADVDVFEGGRVPLAKVARTGGGRCNLTNSFAGVDDPAAVYPRGGRLMKRMLKVFGPEDTRNWFEAEGVRLVLQEDGRVFPVSRDALEIVNMLTRRMRQLGVKLHTGHRVAGIIPDARGYSLAFAATPSEDGTPQKRSAYARNRQEAGEEHPGRTPQKWSADAVVVATGGSPKAGGLRFLDGLGLDIVPPVPSLFTFNLPGDPVRELTGTGVGQTSVSLAGTRFRADGPLLITDWGMSGPAILKLSSCAARYLAEQDYRATLSVNWLGPAGEQEIREHLSGIAQEHPRRQVSNARPEEIPAGLWALLLAKCGIRGEARWAELGSRSLNRLVNGLMNDMHAVRGQSRFKEEFVTCGGVALSNISTATLESRTHPGLYFAGEVLDVDGVTGGFNLQAAWSTGWLAARSIAAQGGGRKAAEQDSF